MAKKKSTKIVLLGKRTKEGENLNHLIKGLLPQFLPNDFIHEMSFTYNDDHIYQIDKDKYPSKIDLNKPQELVNFINYRYPSDLDIIEIILDLEHIKEFLEDTTSELVKNVFNEEKL